MNEFKDRDVQYPNRKKLKIKDIVYDENGEIYELMVDENRNEGEVYETGTSLTAESLNEIINEMIHDQIYKSDEDKVSEDKEKLTIALFVTDNFTLPLLGYNHSNITWVVESGEESISIAFGGAIIVKRNQNTEVTLRAIISNGEATTFKLFNVTILAEGSIVPPTDFSPKNYNICWPQTKGTLKSDILTISSNDGTKLYARVVNENSDKIDIKVTTNNSNTIKVSLNEKETLNQTEGYTNLLFDFMIDIFLDSNRTFKIGNLNGSIEYDFESTTPDD